MTRLMTMLIPLLLIGGLLLPAGVTGHPDPSDDLYREIDAFVEAEMDASRIPGVALAIVDEGQLVHARGFGTAGDGADVSTETLFPIGSLTKSMTALAIMQLVESGAVELDEPVQAYLPWFTTAEPEAAATITVRHLLNQTSGFSRQTGIALVVDRADASLEETVRSLATARLNRPVGDTYEYSNANFAVLSLVVQEVSGVPFGTYLEERIFAPLGMTTATTSLAEARTSDLTAVHRYWFGLPVEATLTDLPGHEPAFVSVADMAVYLTMYLNGGSAGTERVLSAAGIEQMLAPATHESARSLLGTEFTFRYGMGWFVGPFGAAEDARWHLGELPTFNAWMAIMPEQDRAVVVLTNAGTQMPWPGATAVMSRIPTGVVDLLTGEPAPSGLGLSRFYVIFDVVVALVVAVQLVALVRLARRPRGRTVRWRTVVPFLWEVGLGAGILFGMPLLTGMGWRAAFMSVPDLATVLVVVASLWVLTAVVRAWRVVAARRQGRRIGARDTAVPATGMAATAGR